MRKYRWIVIAGLAVILGLAGWRLLQPVKPVPSASQESATDKPAEKTASQEDRPTPQKEENKPEIEITPDHQLSRVRYKNADGLVTLEKVQTPEGLVTIHRVFRSSDKALLKEEAFLNDKPVPMPDLSK